MSNQSASMIDLSGLSDDAKRRIEWQVQSVIDDDVRRNKWKNLCESGTDEEIIAAASEYARTGAVAIASTYDHVDRCQEIVAWAVLYHPRRPVLMRGSKGARVMLHSRSSGYGRTGSSNGWCEGLVERYIRMKKITVLENHSLRGAIEPFLDKIRAKYSVSYHFYRNLPDVVTGRRWSDEGGGLVYVAGKQRCLSRSELQNVRALRNIIDKTEKLETRIKKAREHFKSRMSANA